MGRIDSKLSKLKIDNTKLKEEVERFRKRDCKATITLSYSTEEDHFATEELKIIDIGVSDNAYMVESKVVDDLQFQLDTANKRLEEYREFESKLRGTTDQYVIAKKEPIDVLRDLCTALRELKTVKGEGEDEK